MQRRQFMTVVSVGLLSGTGAGCLLRPNPQDATVNIAPASVDEDASAVLYADFPQAEQEIAQTTLTEGFYHVCSSGHAPVVCPAIRSRRLCRGLISHVQNRYVWVVDSDYRHTASVNCPIT
ncbi:hypothetical protein [Haloquadratum walsbyi]|uniref:Uncharacterized protein n=1 Tax=Haloquadratum walsbyi J07HQW2 TaxID=1238425 RepID=U1PJU7_9EURY|nr:hypothetical protein [Haloquadratum walsbyi]ERG93932.1 MAG: hypothetical protein J07HQW2_00366 [Haloquadratum walsbyi J07HQW2]